MNYKYFLYYFIFTLVFIGIRGQLSESVSVLSEPVIEDFFNLTGIFSLFAYFIFKNKSEKRGVNK